MGSIGIWQIVIVGLLVVLLFGRGKISDLMGDVAKGINSFKKGLKEDADVAEKTDSSAAKPLPKAEGEPIDVTPKKDHAA